MCVSGIFILSTAVRSLATFIILILLLQIIINEELKKIIIFSRPKHILIFIRILLFKLLIVLLFSFFSFFSLMNKGQQHVKNCLHVILDFLAPPSGEKILIQLRNFTYAGFFVKSVPDPESQESLGFQRVLPCSARAHL